MLRRITKAVGRWREGETRDYPLSVWNKIAADLGRSLDSFSVPADNPLLQSPLKGRVTLHKRLGATQ